MTTLDLTWGVQPTATEDWGFLAFETLSFLDAIIPNFLEIVQATPSHSAAVAHVDFLIHETKKPHQLKYFRDFLKGDTDQQKLAFYVEKTLKNKSRDLAPKVSFSSPDAHINVVIPAIIITMGGIVGAAVLAATAKWVTEKLLNKYGPTWLDKEPDAPKSGTIIIITRVSQSLYSPVSKRDITTDEVIAEIKSDLESAKSNVPKFPDGMTWTVEPQSSSRMEDVLDADSSNGDVFTGIAGILTGLGGLLSPIKQLGDLIIELKRGSTLDITYNPMGPKDAPTEASFTIKGVKVKELKRVIGDLEAWSKAKHPTKSGLEGQNAAIAFVEDPNAEDFIKKHPE